MTRRLPTPAEFFRLAVAFEGGLVVVGLAIGWLMSPPTCPSAAPAGHQ